MTNRQKVITGAVAGIAILIIALAKGGVLPAPLKGATNTPGASITARPKVTNTPSLPTDTPAPTDTPTPTHEHETATDTPEPSGPTDTPTALPPAGTITPYPSAPLCLDHDNAVFHTLWNPVVGCHYDHEHGESPFTPEVAAAFPGMDLFTLLGGVQIGSTNPSSPMENTHKHGGMKWQADVDAPHNCELGFEGGEVAVDAYAIQYHDFGDYSIELEARQHSAAALMRQCVDDSGDYGYVYTVQLQDYGQRLFAYQGRLMDGYPNNPLPPFPVGLAPYFTSDCIHCGAKQDTRAAKLAANANVNTTWTSKKGTNVDGSPTVPGVQTLLTLLFRTRDLYQVADQADLTYPYTFVWMCSPDGGLTFAPEGCRYNNSTSQVHEVQGVIPTEWDNQAFDSDPRVGRITGTVYTTDQGILNPDCIVAGDRCHPVVMYQAYVGFYSSFLINVKEDQFTPRGNPERDIYFCAGVVCSETSPGAVASGWIGPSN